MTDQLGFDFSGDERPSDPAPSVDQTRKTQPTPAADPSADTAPTPQDPDPIPQVLVDLRRLSEERPLERKLLVGSTRGEGRELLRSLVRSGVDWVGWEATTIGPLAAELAASDLATSGATVIDDFEFTRLVDLSIDRVLVDRSVEGYSELAESLGFRETIRSAVSTLRMGGIASATVRKARMADHVKRRVLADILEAYETYRTRDNLADPAMVLELALRRLTDGPCWEGARIAVLPGLTRRGLAGKLLDRLLSDHEAVQLCADPVIGLDSPKGVLWRAGTPVATGSWLHDPGKASGVGSQFEVFSATTVSEEVREVLRRVLAQGLAWDEVEIITPDPRAYGSALYVICEKLGIPVTFGVGLPIERTRPGRVVTEFFRWIESGFSADVIRGLLAAGDLRPPDDGADAPTAMDLARAFRNLRIGWGRDRYRRRIDRRLSALGGVGTGRHESRSDADRRRGREHAALQALHAILTPTLEAIPPGVPDPARGPDAGPVTPAGLARGLELLLDRVHLRDVPDETAMARLRQVLARVRNTLTRPSSFRVAAAIVQGRLDIAVPSPREDGRAPWSTRHGHLHLTDLHHGGRTGRPMTFIVGMDAGRFPGAGRQDPLLLDRERVALAASALATSAERLSEETFGFARLIARLRGTVTVSYATWEPTEGKELAPAAEVLNVYRLASGDTDALFETLRNSLGDAAGVVPDGSPLDDQDAWMAGLFDGGRTVDGRVAVAQAFPSHERGTQAVQAAARTEVSPWVGRLQPRPSLDPRGGSVGPLSASALEALGSCPRRYLFRNVLSLRPPQDPPYDPDRWLTPLDRGGLMHRVYEAALRSARDAGLEPADDAFLENALAVLRRETELAKDLHPVPSREVRDRELDALREDVRSFVALIRERGADWRALERRFGFDEEPPVEIRLYGGSIHLRGAIDRVDALDDGLLVVDYKTGSSYSADGDTGVFDGGRRLQNIVYSMVAREIEDEPVARMEYHYATRKARNSVLGFSSEQLRNGPFLIDRMLDGVAAGAFPATENRDDCRYCDFRDACRVRLDGEGIESPLASWTKRAMTDSDDPSLLEYLRDVRGEEGPGIALPLEELRRRP